MLYYFSHIVNDSNVISERDPISAEAGRLRTLFISKAVEKPVRIISMGNPRRSGFYLPKKERVDDKIEIVYLPVINISFLKFVKYVFYFIAIFFYCIFSVKKNSKVLIYNAIAVCLPVFFLKRVKRFEVILEIEELYSSYGQKSIGQIVKNGTEKYMISKSDRYIIANANIASRVNKDKTVLLNYGYRTLGMPIKTEIRVEDRPIIVYSGRLDHEGGVEVLLEAIKYIDKACKVIITGSGKYERYIEKYDSINEKVELKYLGFISREKYEELLLNARVCVNPIRAKELFAEVSFPSKILQYLEYGKIVASSNISAIDHMDDKLKRYIHVYKNDSPAELGRLLNSLVNLRYNPEEIAGAVKSFFHKQEKQIKSFLA